MPVNFLRTYSEFVIIAFEQIKSLDQIKKLRKEIVGSYEKGQVTVANLRRSTFDISHDDFLVEDAKFFKIDFEEFQRVGDYIHLPTNAKFITFKYQTDTTYIPNKTIRVAIHRDYFPGIVETYEIFEFE